MKTVKYDNYINDKNFMKELDKRVTDLEQGITKGRTWNEVRKKANKYLNAMSKQKGK